MLLSQQVAHLKHPYKLLVSNLRYRQQDLTLLQFQVGIHNKRNLSHHYFVCMLSFHTLSIRIWIKVVLMLWGTFLKHTQKSDMNPVGPYRHWCLDTCSAAARKLYTRIPELLKKVDIQIQCCQRINIWMVFACKWKIGPRRPLCFVFFSSEIWSNQKRGEHSCQGNAYLSICGRCWEVMWIPGGGTLCLCLPCHPLSQTCW